MFTKFLSHPLFHAVVIGGIVAGVMVCLFPHYVPSLSWGVNYAIPLMLLYFFAGILMLLLRQPRLTFAFFGGCAFLCIFLKYSVRSDGLNTLRNVPTKRHVSPPPQAPEAAPDLKVAHFNLTNVDSLPELMAGVRNSDADLVSIHEVTPDWAVWLADSLTGLYPHHHTMVDIGIFGMAVFSRHELSQVDTFFYQEIPHLQGCLQTDFDRLCFVSVHTRPALNRSALQRLRDHLGALGEQVRKSEQPLVVVGDFNAVSWSGEIQQFLQLAGLMESRTGFMPYPFVSTSSLFEVPVDHIFFSRQLQCNGFSNLTNRQAEHLGISGSYSRKPAAYHVNEKAQ